MVKGIVRKGLNRDGTFGIVRADMGAIIMVHIWCRLKFL
jgi:hypothetical protein